MPPPLHRLVIRTVRDENARALRLLSGRADIAPGVISPTLLPALAGRAGLSVVSRPGANLTYLLMQNDRAPFNRVAVRHAVAQAIDRELVVRTLLAGRAEVSSSILPRRHWAYAPVSCDNFSPEQARRVLATLPPVTLLTSTDRLRLNIARSLAQMLQDAGLETRVVALELAVLLSRLDAGDFELALLQIPELGEPNILRWFFHPGGIVGEGGQGKNRARYRSPIAARLLDQGATVSDRGIRRQIYGEFARLMARDLPVIALWHEDQVAVVSPRARGFIPSADGRWLSVAGLR